jgi:hypothetical protein
MIALSVLPDLDLDLIYGLSVISAVQADVGEHFVWEREGRASAEPGRPGADWTCSLQWVFRP